MFDKETVFILGAGASWHYGYPTGYDLIEKILNKADIIIGFEPYRQNGIFSHYEAPPLCYLRNKYAILAEETANLETWSELKKDCKELLQRIKATDPLSIDAFLTRNKNVEKIAKILIGWILLESSIKYKESTWNPNRLPVEPNEHKNTPTKKDDNWIKFILSKILNAENISDNKVQFITFNYDLSLENKLKEGLINTEIIEEKEIEKFFEDRIHHVYGKIVKQPNFDEVYKNYKSKNDEFLGKIIDLSYEASKELDIISPKKNGELSDIIKKIKNAKNIYILGYGFDDMNNDNLKLQENLKVVNTDNIYFTNKNDKNNINKKVGTLLSNYKTIFLKEFIYTTPNSKLYCEKSVKDVYRALSEDFDL
ncbi:MAG: hypothetical protein R3D88_02685 [Alphaproteobacteria bacterium]|nr:hypothetical protein [Alphaproteobacteria bacterium]